MHAVLYTKTKGTGKNIGDILSSFRWAVHTDICIQCNRECPCNHCSRRQCSEACVYYPTTASQAASPPSLPESRKEEIHPDYRKSSGDQSFGLQDQWNANVNPTLAAVPRSGLSLSDSFGYSNDSDSNTLALIRKASIFASVSHHGSYYSGNILTCSQLGLARQDSLHSNFPAITPEAVDEIHRHIERMPNRQIMDFLMQFFVAEVNWFVLRQACFGPGSHFARDTR